ncbi:SpoIIE family protein phosphatase [Saccharomonospora sp.]|uniref:ATP-binding SpoIIE family protein phosphatase n=1 Tax=Saccharomonospora sp. TaxID=33913 RepID=UPI002624BBA1|nr:SpoIIE family protein phosphatase [Saccharomonospora sp.]
MPRAVDNNSTEDRLRRIEAITDTQLAHLGTEDVLQELLGRVRNVLGADTATVLLLDNTGQQLVATASSGLEEEVRQGVRVRVGEGFAGRIATELKPHVIDDVNAETVVNPLLWRKGLRGLVGVPLLTEGELLGILHVGTLSKRAFDDEEVHWLRLVADRMAVSLRGQLTADERNAATALQRSLLPSQLPAIPGLDLASRYVPGERLDISGDWYDVFPLPSGRVCMVIGDVVGRGLSAAMVMGRLRTTVRSYCLDCEDPGELLTKIDRYVRHFDSDVMATIACGVWEPSLERVHLSLAGHLSPVFAAAEDESRLVTEAPVDAPIGVSSATQRRHSTAVDVPYGAALLFYTDGLVERRHQPLDEGLRQLREAVHAGPAELLCADVMSRLVGVDPPGDDIAVLAVRRQHPEAPSALRFDVDAVPESLAEVRSQLRRWLPNMGASADDTADLLVAVGEAVANSIEHAYGPQGGKVCLRLEAHGDEVEITVSDTGMWRSPRGTHRGRGTQLMRQLCDELTVSHSDGGTHVQLRKRLAKGEAE